ncbi:AraC family transcriptional regulator [Clostridium bowmanii]|uniref:AraC family transcriptional regulator n=1 Tax=Clostridium bowmanii TaxID=132925 RepID=UPI001C0C406C|nr:AraC family transcriptional regulator [Clostridium bowmanii]MBU3191024.1 AraC family transcriptional regulator [Clostridium bowmanii]MCA1075346.1 AraC family transcriptional regulator [Clostridium bowmanii]
MKTQIDYDFLVTTIGHVAERLPNPEWKVSNLIHTDLYILAYAIDGEATYFFNNNSYKVKKGDIIFFKKGFLHSAFSNPQNPWHFYTISFNVEFADEWSKSNFESFSHILSSPNSYRMNSLMSGLNNIWTGKRPGYLIKSRSFIMDMLYYLIKDNNSASWDTTHYQTIEKIANMIQSNHTNNYSVEELAKLSGLSPSHFRLLFKKITGFTTVQYQNHIRINKARDLLISGNCNVSEASLTVGYHDIYYFSRLFKKKTGMNPSEYIKR